MSAFLRYETEAGDHIRPNDDEGAPFCAADCPSFDGKRCVVMGQAVRPGVPCLPAIREMRAELRALKSNLNAAGHPPPGGVPAARPEGEPGAAAVLPAETVTYPRGSNGDALSTMDPDTRSRWRCTACGESLVAGECEGREAQRRHRLNDCGKRPTPGAAAVFVDGDGLAVELRRVHGLPGATSEQIMAIERLVAKHTHPAPEGLAARMRAALVHWFISHGPLCKQCPPVDDATPVAVAALDRAAAENAALRAAAGRLIRQLDAWGCELPGPVWKAAEDLRPKVQAEAPK